MSDLRQAVADYLAIRRALGFQLRGYDRLLGDLVDELRAAEASTLTTELAVAWATKPAGAQPFRWKTRLSVARGFARYLQTIDPAAQVPPSDLLAYRRARPAPYLYSAAETDALLAASDTLRPALRAATYRTLLGLLAVTGMRVGEAIALDRDDVDPRARTLAIRAGKHASRQLPLHASTAQALHACAGRRDQLAPRRAFTTCVTASPCRRCWNGTAPASTSPRDCRCYRHGWATTTRRRPTTTCTPPRS